MAVPVVIHKGASCAEARLGSKQAGLSGNVGKGAIAIVVIEAILAEVGNEKIFIAVIIEVADANAVSPPSIHQSRFFSNIRECAVTIVPIQAVAGSDRNTIQLSAPKDENVHPAVVVVVEKGTTRAHDFDDVGCRVRFAI